MIALSKKIKFLEYVLAETATNYADSFKIDIQFQLVGYRPEQLNELFLSRCINEDDIRNWVDKLTSRIVMHEDEEDVNEIIQDYVLNG
jgi:hypothetical protein